MKKGQVTFFIILGIVILFFFLFLIQQSNTQKKALLDTAEKELGTMFDQLPIKNYINLCIEQVSKDAFSYIGNQGGFIYDYQGGIAKLNRDEMHDKNLFIDFEGSNITYAIYYNQSKNSTFISPPPPTYPTHPSAGVINNLGNLIFPGFSTSNQIMFDKNGILFEPFKYYLGDIIFPKLCLNTGKNYLLANDAGFLDVGCPDDSYGNPGELTIQEQVEIYVNDNLANCTKFSNLTKDLPEYSFMDITEGNIVTSILFGDDDLELEVNYPIKISLGSRNSRIIMNKFKINLPLRIKKMWKHINRVLKQDVLKFSYDKSNFYTLKTSFWEEGFNSNITNLGFEDLYILEDEKSSIDEQNYKFNILFPNRIPALEYIHMPALARPELSCFDMILLPGTKIDIQPEGYDPDEDLLNYDYQGWNEDYTSAFNDTCFFISGGSVNCDSDFSRFEACENKIDNSPRAWTTSPEYQGTNKDASYSTNDNDVGLHTLKVRVTDGQEADWQEIKILIVDIPTVVVTTDNLYDDLENETYTSIEDHFLIDTSKSKAFMASLQNFYYADLKEGWNFTLSDARSVLIPRRNAYDEGLYDIKEIKDEMKYRFHYDSSDEEHKVILRADNGFASGSDNISVYVKECMPHRSTTDSYPYNLFTFNFRTDNSENNPYQANHACCLGEPNNPDTWELANTAVNCFGYTEYGAFNVFNNSIIKRPYLVNLTNPSTQIVHNGINLEANSISTTSDFGKHDNDIFVREFNRNCDGTRGNVCNGTISDVIQIGEECDDTLSNGQIRRCSGPPQELFQGVFDNSEPSCDNYEWDTFEYYKEWYFNNNQDDTLKSCNENFKCSTSGTGSTYDSITTISRYSCQATCDGSGGCTKAVNCQDCYQDVSCTDTEDPGSLNSKTINVKGIITGKTNSGCTNGVGCVNSVDIIGVEDSCNLKTLKEYYCTGDVNNPYDFTDFDCTASPYYTPTCDTTTFKEKSNPGCNSGKCDYQLDDCDVSNGYGCRNATHCTKTTTSINRGCIDDGDCVTGYHCYNSVNPGTCQKNEIGYSCDIDAECGVGNHCFNDNQLCYPNIIGASCDSNSDCGSNFCNITGTRKCYS